MIERTREEIVQEVIDVNIRFDDTVSFNRWYGVVTFVLFVITLITGWWYTLAPIAVAAWFMFSMYRTDKERLDNAVNMYLAVATKT